MVRTPILAESSLAHSVTCHQVKGGDPTTDNYVVTGGFFDQPTHSLRADGFDAYEDGTGRGTPLVPVMTLAIRGRDGESTLEVRTDGLANAVLTPNGGRAGMGVGAIAFDTTQITSKANYSNPQPGAPCHPLAANAHPPAIATPMAVRRLTVVECARLQGFDDLYTHIETSTRRKIDPDEADYLTAHSLNCWQEDGQWFTRIAADGPMYKAYGNSQAVPCMRWIGERIQAVKP
jgi:DNA (cytosine-5)-methyltransferase 1